MLVMVGLGIMFAVVLAFANQKLKVEEDPGIEELTQKLPGLNCGACGFPSCRILAEGIINKKEEALNSMCRAASPEVQQFIAGLLPTGKTVESKIAVVFCGAGDKDRTKRAVYKGINTCRSADLIFGGGISCAYGCLGFGDCQRSCPFAAIEMADGLPKITADKCVGCGKCVEACPRGIIELMPRDVKDLAVPACRSKEAGSVVRKICSVGCIACRICERLSGGVFYVDENLAKVRKERLKEDVKWDEIIKKCPTKTIVRIR